MVNYRRVIKIFDVEFAWSQPYINQSWLTLQPIKYALKSVVFGDIFDIGVAIHMPLVQVHATLDSHTGLGYYFKENLTPVLIDKKAKQLNNITFNNAEGVSTTSLFRDLERLNKFLESLKREDFEGTCPPAMLRAKILKARGLDSKIAVD